MNTGQGEGKRGDGPSEAFFFFLLSGEYLVSSLSSASALGQFRSHRLRLEYAPLRPH